MATCRTHPDREAPSVCSGCAGSFCEACVVRFEKLLFCEACKARYLAGVDEGPRAPRTGPGARARKEPRAAPSGRPLDWLLGAAALVFSAVFVVIIIAALAKPVRAILEDRQMSQAFDQLVQVGAAIERYRADKGSYPDTLQALVPTYLAKLPEDPYSGEPPRYEKAPTHRLWSVGPDQQDGGGIVEESDDLVYAVEPIAGS